MATFLDSFRLLDVVAHALRTLPELSLPSLPRTADFSAWAIAATPLVLLLVNLPRVQYQTTG